MTALLFVGPTLRAGDLQGLNVECLPPARQGDIYRAASIRQPRVIGIVDGVFQHVPSVWHKEILWAMKSGIHVFGAASMGALRAAELHSFGMVGVGRIFEGYRSGTLEPYGDAQFEDDDEVAVIHGPPETGYLALSEAMVNIRATLSAAVSAGVIGASTREALVRIAKAMFYQERSYGSLLERAAPAGIAAQQIAALRDWLPRGKVNLKRDDALEMLAAMRAFLQTDPAPKQVGYAFAHTTLWDNAVAGCDDEKIRAAAEDPVAVELRLRDGGRAGLWRLLALEECDRRGVVSTVAERRAATAEFRQRRGLGSAVQLQRWLADHRLDQDGFERLMSEEARLDKLASALGAASTPFALDDLRLSGGYPPLAARADEKERSLEDAGTASTTELAAMIWYFEDRLGREIPADLEAYARSTGFADAASFRRAVWREHAYSRSLEARLPRRGAAG